MSYACASPILHPTTDLELADMMSGDTNLLESLHFQESKIGHRPPYIVISVILSQVTSIQGTSPPADSSFSAPFPRTSGCGRHDSFVMQTSTRMVLEPFHFQDDPPTSGRSVASSPKRTATILLSLSTRRPQVSRRRVVQSIIVQFPRNWDNPSSGFAIG